jgi:hypothetical protein
MLHSKCNLISVLILLFFQSACTHPKVEYEKSIIVRDVEAIQNLDFQKSRSQRIELAENLSNLAWANRIGSINEADVYALAGLLSDQDDGVRYWIASTLAKFGTKAKPAVPALLTALSDIDTRMCDTPFDLSSDASIRSALLKITGKEPPLLNCADRKGAS